jgi:hypothetical protein
LTIDQDYTLRITDDLLAGFHEPEASHLDLLSAFIRPDHLNRAYLEAVELGYMWHEFDCLMRTPRFVWNGVNFFRLGILYEEEKADGRGFALLQVHSSRVMMRSCH